jgi:hypothetical protein
VSKYQNKDERDIPRSQIHGAPYNPRKIGRDAARRLRENIRKRKLHGALTVNERTVENGWPADECGFYLVSGHQRIAALDTLEKWDPAKSETDYTVRVSVGHWTPTEEREQNLHFNSPMAQGETDEVMLAAMFEGFDLDVDAAGYDPIVLEDIGIIAGPLTEADDDPEVMAVADQVAAVAATAKDIQQEARDAKAKYREKERAADKGAAFLVHLAFPSSNRAADVVQALRDAGFGGSGEYFNGESIALALGLPAAEGDS